MTHRVLFYVQHLLGVGHVKRASVLARAMVEAGLDVSVVLGGPEVDGISFAGCARIPLPPVRAADETIKTLVDADGAPFDSELRELRTQHLLCAFEMLRPETVLIEQFPFGRRAFREELLSLLAAARNAERPPRVLSSVRDVVVRKARTDRNVEMVRWAETLFDGVLVHGDPEVIRLEASLPEVAVMADRLRYTGYVAEAPPPDRPERVAGRGEVVVSAGGGAVGLPLLQMAVAARPLSRLADRPWRLITGPNLPTEAFDRLAWGAPDGVVVDRWRTDMADLLRNCVLSISQAGYNTIVDVLAARARAVVVPFAGEGQTEQTLRAGMLAKRGVLGMVAPGEATPESLARAVDAAMDATMAPFAVDLTGAPTTARIIAAAGREADAAEA